MLRKVIILFIISTILFSLFSIPIFSFELDKSEAHLDGYYLLDIKNSLIMAEENTDKIISPSSTVKIMTACIVLEKELDFDVEIEITAKMLQNVSGRNMELKPNDKLTVNDLLHAMLCGGFNDAAVALALTVSPSLYEFVNLMNEKAELLGMSKTRYTNVTGVESEAAKTTINDIAILTEYMAQNERFVEICSTKFYRFSDNATSKYTSVNNRSSLISSYKGLANFNTGSSKNGDCAIVYYKTEDSELISIVMNASAIDENDTSNRAEIFTEALIDHALKDYSTITVKSAKEPIAILPIKYSISNDEIPLYLTEDLKLFLSKNVDIISDLIYTVNIDDGELKAPIKEGDTVGYLTVAMNGTTLANVPIITKTSVERHSFLFAMDVMREFVTSFTFILIILVIFIFIAIHSYSKKHKFRKKKRKRKNKSKKLKK